MAPQPRDYLRSAPVEAALATAVWRVAAKGDPDLRGAPLPISGRADGDTVVPPRFLHVRLHRCYDFMYRWVWGLRAERGLAESPAIDFEVFQRVLTRHALGGFTAAQVSDVEHFFRASSLVARCDWLSVGLAALLARSASWAYDGFIDPYINKAFRGRWKLADAKAYDQRQLALFDLPGIEFGKACVSAARADMSGS